MSRLGAPLRARAPRAVIAAWLLLCALCALPAATVFDRLSSGGFTVAGAESDRAADVAGERFGRDTPDAILLFRSEKPAELHGRALVTAVENAWRPLADRTAQPDRTPRPEPGARDGPDGRDGPDTAGRARLTLSEDGQAVLLSVLLRGDDDESKRRTFARLRADLRPPANVSVIHGGSIPFLEEASARSRADLVRAEMIAAPVLLVLLILVFGSVVAAVLPLCIGGIAVLVALAVLRVASSVTEISVFAVNTVTMVGFGLAVDYGLLIITRFREERRLRGATDEALTATLRTAGHTVAFSAGLVAVALAALAFFPLAFMRSLAIGGVAVVVAAAGAALTALPALLGLLGRRLDKGRSPLLGDRSGRHRAAAGGHRRHAVGRSGFWYGLALLVARRPALWLAACTAVLVAAALPVTHVAFAGISERTLPESSETRRVLQAVHRDFPAEERARIEAVVRREDGPIAAPEGRRALREWLAAAERSPRVGEVEVVATEGDAALVAVRPADTAPAVEQTAVRQLRETRAPPGLTVLVGGDAAFDVDMLAALRSHVLPVALAIALVTFVVLVLMFRSLLLPAKAVLTSLLSTCACLGAMTWVFQDGWLSGALGFTPLGFVEATQPMVVVVVLFALSMDYELFLLSRVREEYLRTGTNTRAVTLGLTHTSGLITSAALLLLVVIAAFSTSSVVAIKEVGVGLFVGILLDATLVRMLLVPGALFLAGRANWWVPAFLKGRPAGRDCGKVRLSPP
ncbi:MMPL family transporter [Streptomyces sp. URMC 123]|uniref:MMPL family transporter n=1 Tax=Streptomyces sp. URMC 123 TaxID=3423403 RepID=UPI003F1AFE91